VPKEYHFKDSESYRKFNAYRFIHGVNKGTHAKVFIHGKKHKVMHS